MHPEIPAECEIIHALDRIRRIDRAIKAAEDLAVARTGQTDERLQAAYARRNVEVYGCIFMANIIGWEAGIRIDPASPEWPVAYIETPQGQLSWHLPQHPHEWDGHSTDLKNERIIAAIRAHATTHEADGADLAAALKGAVLVATGTFDPSTGKLTIHQEGDPGGDQEPGRA